MPSDNHSPLVSAIVSTYNAERFLRGCLEDLLAQTLGDRLEIIVIDSGSLQQERTITQEFRDQHANIVYLRTEEREGTSEAINRGAALAKGAYLTLANTDDRHRHDALEIMARALAEHPEVGVVYGDVAITHQENETFEHSTAQEFFRWRDFNLRQELRGHFFGPQPMWRKSVHDSIGGWNPAYRISNDYDFFLQAGWRFGALHIREVLGLYLRSPAGNELSNIDQGRQENLSFLKHYRTTIPLEAIYPELTLSPSDAAVAAAYTDRGNCAILSDWFDLELAIGFYDEAIKISGPTPELIHNKAIARHLLGDKTAIRDMRQNDGSDTSVRLFPAAHHVVTKATEARHLRLTETGELAEHCSSADYGRLTGFLLPYPKTGSSFPPKSRPCGAPPLVSIVLVIDNLDQAQHCVASIRQHTKESHELVLIAQDSEAETLTWLRDIGRDDSCTIIEYARDLPRGGQYNYGIEAATGRYLLMLSIAAVVTEGWLAGMLAVLEHSPEIGIVGPMTNNSRGKQRVATATYSTMADMELFAANFWRRNRHRRIPARQIDTMCILFRRVLLEKTGQFDEHFSSATFVVDDFCLRSALAGFTTILAGDIYIHSQDSATTRTNSPAVLTGDTQIFARKWGYPAIAESTAKELAILLAFEKASELCASDDLEAACRILRGHVIKTAPDDPRGYCNLAGMLIEGKRFQDALAILEGLPTTSQETRQLVLSGACKAGLKRYQEAGQLADRALNIAPSTAPALRLKGSIAVHHGDTLQAENLFRKAIEADHSYGEPYTNLGELYWHAGKKGQAIDLLEKGFILSPDCIDNMTAYHSAIMETGAFLRAEIVFRDARTLHPRNRRINFLLIDCLLQQGHYQAAMSEIEQSILSFGSEEGLLNAALAVRNRIGPLVIQPNAKGARSVSLCMIVKNEEKNLPRCLASLKPVVDEIIIVDTGSTDQTRELARIFGAQVFEHTWDDDFSAARNTCLRYAQGDWILAMDADEVISPLDHEDFKALLNPAHTDNCAYDFITRNYLMKGNAAEWTPNDGRYALEEAGAGWVPSNKVRLFPRRDGLVWEHTIHEMIEPSLHRQKIRGIRTTIPIHHYGKLDQERETAKLTSYYEMGKKKLEESGVTPEALRELAIQANGLGRYEEAAQLWQMVITDNPTLAMAHFNMGFSFLQLGRFVEARAATLKALELKPDLTEAVVNYAMSEICVGDRQQAIACLEQSLAGNPNSPVAMTMLTTAYLCERNSERGLAYLKKLQGMGLQIAEFLYDAGEKLCCAGKTAFAEALLEAGARAYPTNEQISTLLNQCKQASHAHGRNETTASLDASPQ